MSIHELTSAIKLPKKPKNVGSTEAWSAICKEVDVQLPDDYRDFCLAYGSGTFCGEIWIKNAFEKGYPTWFATGLQRAGRFHDDHEMPYPAHPVLPGVVRLGGDALGNEMFYLVGKKQWSLVTMKHEDECEAETHKLPLTSFLAKLFGRKFSCNIWNEDNYLAEDGELTFQPTA